MDRKYIDNVILNKMPSQESYLYSLPVIQHLAKAGCIPIPKDVTFFVGENGTGKSTLLEAVAVACGFNPEGGTKNFTFSTNKTHSELYEYLTISKSKFPKDGFFLRAESFYNLATNIEELDEISAASPLISGSYGGKSLHHQSHGESFMALVQNRFGGNGLYILDEPEAALSPLKQLTLIAEIDRLVRNNSQFIISTHSPILLAFPDAHIYQLTEDGIAGVSYNETEHYKLAKQFLDDPERMLRILLEE